MSINLIDSFAEFKETKHIDRATMVRVVEDVFRAMIKKRYESDDNFDIIVNPDKGDLEIFRRREIVEQDNVEDENSQIELTSAKRIDNSYEVGEDCYEPVDMEIFGRRLIMSARQTLISRIMELDKDLLYKRYIDRVGEVIYGEVSQVLKKEVLIFDEDTQNELMLPKSEMIRGDFFRKGDMIKALIKKVDMKNNNPQVILSRTDDRFLERLIESEVPEIEDGTILLKKAVRMPGERAKIAVESYDERVDPVGACVGPRGARIHGIVKELRNENIDIINYTANPSLYIQRALTPARVSRIALDEDRRKATVYLQPEEVSKAIGKNGLNIKLATRLTGWDIDVRRDSEDANEEYDIDLEEFSDEIDGWVIDVFKGIGLDTARSVLSLSTEELTRRSDLEEETVLDVIRVLEAEFSNNEQN